MVWTGKTTRFGLLSFSFQKKREAFLSLSKRCEITRDNVSLLLFLSYSLALSLFSDLALLFSLLSLSKDDVRKCCFVLASSRARTRRTALLSVSLTSRVACFLLMKPLSTEHRSSKSTRGRTASACSGWRKRAKIRAKICTRGTELRT